MSAKLMDYFNKEPRLGTLSTADKEGKVNAACFGSPRMIDEKTVLMGISNNRTQANLRQNPHGVFMIMEPGASMPEWKGVRVYLKMISIETEGENINQIRAQLAKMGEEGKMAATMMHAAVLFTIEEIRPVIDIGQGWENSIEEGQGMENLSDGYAKVSNNESITGCIFNIQKYTIQDGPGIRATIFFKGCPLACRWCGNPESQSPFPQVLHTNAHCVRCYRCITVCPNDAISVKTDGSIGRDRTKCKACGKCIEACYNDAISLCGKAMTVEEVYSKLRDDYLFYRNSGGGITASGGEATLQPKFLIEVFKRCQHLALHTTLDTCGYVPWKQLASILEYTDLVLYDIKHMDAKKHKRLIGVDNALILENALKLAKNDINFIIRVPLIPGFNDSIENLEALAAFVIKLGKNQVEVVPFHKLGSNKYKSLDIEDKMQDIKLFEKEELFSEVKALESYGLDVRIV